MHKEHKKVILLLLKKDFILHYNTMNVLSNDNYDFQHIIVIAENDIAVKFYSGGWNVITSKEGLIKFLKKYEKNYTKNVKRKLDN